MNEYMAEAAEARADYLREERMLDPKLNAWLQVTELPSYKDLSEPMKALAKGLFDTGWTACNLHMVKNTTVGK